MRSQDTRKALVMVAVFLLFLVCWTPYMLGALLRMLGAEKDEVVLTRNIGLCIASSNACLNAGVYGWKKPEFRSAFKRILLHKRSANAVVPYTDSPTRIHIVSLS